MTTAKDISSVLVTGADGFIGSHLVEELVTSGYKVTAFVQYNSFNSWGWLDNCKPELKGKFTVVAGDIRDPHGVKNAMAGCDAVAHLAALIAIPFSYNSPDSYVDTNIKGTLNVLQAARELSIKRVIHTSTSEVYGTAKVVPITEEHPLQGQSPYSATKIAADQLAYSFFKSFGLPVVILRPFNTYGPRMRLNDGRVLPAFIGQALRGQDLTIFGDGSQTRSFCYVDDLVEGIVRLLMSDYPYPVNVGNPSEITIAQFAEEIIALTGTTQKVIYQDLPVDDPKQRQPDITKAREILGWEPKIDRSEGLKRTYAYFQSLSQEELMETDHYNFDKYITK